MRRLLLVMCVGLGCGLPPELEAGMEGERVSPLEVGPWWISAGSVVAQRDKHTATLLPSGKVLVTGGSDPSGHLRTAVVYDPDSGTWSPTGLLTDARDKHTATPLLSGKVLVTGGYGPDGRPGGGELRSTEVYDPEKGTWSTAGSLGTARSSATATLLPSGKVLVTGGYGPEGPLDTAEMYDPDEEEWSTTDRLATPRYNHTATLLPSGQVLITGGQYQDRKELDTTEVYDPNSGKWSQTGRLITARHLHTATLLPSGKVLVTGGRNDSDGFLASAELYDPAKGEWIPIQPMATARDKHSATLLVSGKVLVTGGQHLLNSGQGPVSVALASAEIYDPNTERWSPTSSLVTPRFWHTETLLLSGKVLVIGGDESARQEIGGEFHSAELYDDLPPTAPEITQPFQNQDFYTTLTPDMTGKAEPGSKVKVILDGAAAVEVSADATGAWSYTPPERLELGLRTLSVIATDGSGNSSEPSSVSFRIDLPSSHYGWDCASVPTLPASGVWWVVALWLGRRGRRQPACPPRS